MITIGLGTGGIKANVTPMCAEQYKEPEVVVQTLKSGEIVVVDPQLTVQKLFMWYALTHPVIQSDDLTKSLRL